MAAKKPKAKRSEDPWGGLPVVDAIKRLMATCLTEAEIRKVFRTKGAPWRQSDYARAQRELAEAADHDLRPFLIAAEKELYREAMKVKDHRQAQRALKALQLLNAE